MWKIIVGTLLVIYAAVILIAAGSFGTGQAMAAMFMAVLPASVGALLYYLFYKEQQEEKERSKRAEEWARREQQERERQEQERLRQEEKRRLLEEAKARRQGRLEQFKRDYAFNPDDLDTITNFVQFYWEVTYLDCDYEATRNLNCFLLNLSHISSDMKQKIDELRLLLADCKRREQYFDLTLSNYYKDNERRKGIDKLKSRYINIDFRVQHFKGTIREKDEFMSWEIEDFVDSYWFYTYYLRDRSAQIEFDRLIEEYYEYAYIGGKYEESLVSDLVSNTSCVRKYMLDNSSLYGDMYKYLC